MRRVRNWLMILMCISLVIAIAFDWTVICKIEVVTNAMVLLGCIAVELAVRK